MKQNHFRCLYIMCLLTTACHANQVTGASSETQATVQAPHATTIANPYTPSQDTARTALTAPAASSPDVPAALLDHLQKGQPYVQFRKQVLANGWVALPTKMCMANVVGGNYKSLCASHPGLSSCHLCGQMPELNACSGDGYCGMQFRHAGTPKILQVTTYGDTAHWDQANSDLTIIGWGFSTSPDK